MHIVNSITCYVSEKQYINILIKNSKFDTFCYLDDTIHNFNEAIHKTEAGLLMSKSHIKYAQEHYKVWSLFRLTGMNLSNKFMNDVYNSGMFWQGISHLR